MGISRFSQLQARNFLSTLPAGQAAARPSLPAPAVADVTARPRAVLCPVSPLPSDILK